MSGLIATSRQAAGRPSGARLVNFKPVPHAGGVLFAYCDIDFGGWVLSAIPLFRAADGGISPGTPSAPDIGPDGRQREQDGKKQFRKVLTFTNAEARARWDRNVLRALADAGITGAQ